MGVYILELSALHIYTQSSHQIQFFSTQAPIKFIIKSSQQRKDHFIMGIKTNITLYTEGTPNGLKASIVLEELGLDYKVQSRRLHASLPSLT